MPRKVFSGRKIRHGASRPTLSHAYRFTEISFAAMAPSAVNSDDKSDALAHAARNPDHGDKNERGAVNGSSPLEAPGAVT
jgi:hypothetical protein